MPLATFEKLHGTLPTPNSLFLLRQANCTKLPDVKIFHTVSIIQVQSCMLSSLLFWSIELWNEIEDTSPYPRVRIIRIECNSSLVTLNGSLCIKDNATIIMAQKFESVSILRVQFGRRHKMFSSFFLGFLRFPSFFPQRYALGDHISF